MDTQLALLTIALESAKSAGDKGQTNQVMKERREYERKMAERMGLETRDLLKQLFSYPIFLYEAEKVGITATGDDDTNELGPKGTLPPEVEKSALEEYAEFRAKPNAYLLSESA